MRAAAIGIAILLGAGCSDDEDFCVPYCEAVLAADCGDRTPACADECRDGMKAWTDEGYDCDAEFDDVLDCFSGQTFHCENGLTLPPGDACSSEVTAANDCLGLEGGTFGL